MIYYPIPLHRQRAFDDSDTPELPITDNTAAHCLSLPIFPEMTEAQIETVCDAVLKG